MPDDRLPWFQFETVAWRGDANLRTCSALSRAVWLEMMLVMHEAEPRGYFVQRGGTRLDMDLKSFSKISAYSVGSIKRAIAELDVKRIFSRTPEGVIFSRKMVRDEKRREADRNRQRNKRDKDRDIDRDVTPDVTRDSTHHVTDTGARPIAGESLRVSDQDPQNHKSTAPNGAESTDPVEKSPDARRGLSVFDRREIAKSWFAGLSEGEQHSKLCALVTAELEGGGLDPDADDGDQMAHLKDVAARAKYAPVTGEKLRKALDSVLTARGLKVGA
jgi:hypothetical protein